MSDRRPPRAVRCSRRQRNGGNIADRLAEYLKRGAATAVIVAGLAAPAAGHELGACHDIGAEIAAVAVRLQLANELITGAAARQDYYGLLEQFPQYMEHTNNLADRVTAYMACAEKAD